MNIDMVDAAYARIKDHARRTPLLSSPFVDEIAGKPVFVKAECLQRTGSFKYRGARSAVSALSTQERAKGVIAFSSGNHAQGVALSAREHGIPAVIIMPADAPRSKIENTKGLGAEVVLYDRANGEDRDKIGADLSESRGLILIKPFDNAQVIAGQGTTGIEIAEQAAENGLSSGDVLVCCGGGGLTSGIALALEKYAPEFTARPVEPEEFDDVTRSLLSGRIERNMRISGSLCDAIITPSPGEMTFPIMQRLCGSGIVVPEVNCLRAMALAFNRLKLVLEPGGAIALAAALWHHKGDDPVIAVASGGNVDAPIFARALSEFGEH